MTYIYGLRDPRVTPVEWRYVGKTVDPDERLKSHCQSCALTEGTYRSRWIKKLLAAGVRPTMCVLEVVREDRDWQESECFWIKHLRDEGHRLTNTAEGGLGQSSEYMSVHNPMKRPEVAVKTAETMRGVKKSTEHCLAMKAAWTPERRRRASTHNVMKRPEVAAKISQVKMGHEVSEETREKLRRHNKGKKKGSQSTEHRRKIAEALRRHHEQKRGNYGSAACGRGRQSAAAG